MITYFAFPPVWREVVDFIAHESLVKYGRARLRTSYGEEEDVWSMAYIFGETANRRQTELAILERARLRLQQ